MTRKELDQLTEDKDKDGIPDRIDSTFDPPEEVKHYEIASQLLCEFLKNHHFSFSKGKGNDVICFAEIEKERYQQLVDEFNRMQQKRGMR